MVKKIPDLKKALDKASSSTKKEKEKSEKPKKETSSKAPTRIGKKMIGGHFEPEIAKALKILAAEEDKTIQEILEEAIGDLLEKYGKPRLTK